MAAVSTIEAFTVTTPPATTKAAAMVTPLTLANNLVVSWIEWRIPDGWNGMAGFWLGSQGSPIIPFAVGGPNWITGNDDREHWDLEDQMDSGAWQVQTYNLGAYPHTLFLRFGLSMPAPKLPPAPALFSNGILSA